MHFSASKTLIEAYYEQQDSLYSAQDDLLAGGVPLKSLRKSAFYVQSLASLSICNELLQNNAQLKELNFYKIQKLRSRISEVTLQIEHFKTLLRTLNHKYGNGN